MNAPDLAGERAHVAERWTQSVLDRSPDSSLVTPDFEYVQHFGSPEGIYVGIKGMERWIATFYEIWDRAHFELESFRGAGDRLLTTGRLFVVAGKTGIDVDILGTYILRFAEAGGSCGSTPTTRLTTPTRPGRPSMPDTRRCAATLRVAGYASRASAPASPWQSD